MDKITNKSTKNEIFAAYEEMLKKVQESKIEEPKKIQEQKQNEKLINEASKHTSDSLLNAITSLKINVGKDLDKLSETIVNEQQNLTQIQKAIELEKANLQNLYAISAEADTLAALVLSQNEKKDAFEKDIIAKRLDFEERMRLDREKIENEIAEKRTAWNFEKSKYENAVKEEKAQQEKERKREEEEYSYNLAITRKKDADEYAEKKLLQEKELKDKQIAFEKEISEREQNVANAEKELAELRKMVNNFPKELETAIANTTKNIEEKLATQYKYEKDILAKETEGEIKLKDQTIASLKEKIKEQEIFIKELSERVNNADRSVKDIAVKAIESSGKMRFVETESKAKSQD